MAKSCPLCGGKLQNNICADCGYEIPDDEFLDRMSELYNFEPEDYPEPKYEEDIMPKRAQVALAEKEEELRHFEVRSLRDTGQESRNNAPQNNSPYQNIAQNQGNPSPQNGGYANRAGVYPANVPNSNQNAGGYIGQTNNSAKNQGVDFFDNLMSGGKMKGIMIVLSLIIPFFGLFVGIAMKKNTNKKELRDFAKVLIILGIIKLFTPL